ncbi:MAG: tryptophan halogenase family protein [Pseudomonadota bacterium]
MTRPENTQRLIKKVVIIGGGTAGWMTAAALSSTLSRAHIDVHLVESEAIGIVGVGEATLPHLRHFNRIIGIDEAEFMAATRATFKLGIEFVDWGRIGDAYLHPFGAFGIERNGVGFHHLWRKFQHEPATGPIGDYSLPVVAARDARFDIPSEDPRSVASTYGYAYQFDATRYAPFLRAHAEQRSARRTEGRVTAVERDPESGDILAVRLDNDLRIEGDLFVDCSGFRGLLIEEALETGYEEWTDWLPCDRAIAMQCEGVGPLLPYTRASADRAGWRWRIPLQHRVGNGHVFSSAFMDEDQARDRLLATLEGPALTEPRTLRFTTGKRRRMWNHNCVAVGLAGGFLEPLESTSIYLVQAAITNLVELLPPDRQYAAERAEYNRILDNEFLRVRDFLILHYHATTRDDSPFWNHVRTMAIPDSLAEKIEGFRHAGRVAEYHQGLFLEASWLAVYLGQGIVPQAWDQRLENVDEDTLREELRNLRQQVQAAARAMPDHEAFLNNHCARGKAA